MNKSEMCNSWSLTGTCEYANKCFFAHGINELNNTNKKKYYKTRLCNKFWTRGECPYGRRCMFIHNIFKITFQYSLFLLANYFSCSAASRLKKWLPERKWGNIYK